MTPIQRAEFLAHGETVGFRRKLSALQKVVADLNPRRTYVSFSAGKDSSVIAHACHAAHPDIPILMIDPGCPTHWLEEERTRWLTYAREHGWNLTLYPWDKWATDCSEETEQQYRDRIHRGMFAAIEARAKADGLTCRVMGIRAEESYSRRMLVATRGEQYDYRDGGRAVLPIARWSTLDVWAYITSYGLPRLGIYDALGPAARNGLIGRNGERFGREEYLRMHFPDAWRWAVTHGVFGGREGSL